jgi:hypothetical protein
MVSIPSLWMPILLSAVLVFVASSLIHMMLRYHQTDFRRLPDEDAFLGGLRGVQVPPGDYAVPHAGSMEAMQSEEYRAKVSQGPVGFFTIVEPGTVFTMTPTLVQWFLYCLLVSIFAAYLAGRMLEPGAEYLDVFRVSGTVAFTSYAVALMQRSIWYKQSWTTTGKSMFDGFVYALLTAGAFGWLWPS